MSTLTKSRRMPAKYCVRASGITEIVYSVTPEVIVILPGTRWLEKRREREARLAAEAALHAAESSASARLADETAPEIDPEMADLEIAPIDEPSTGLSATPDDMTGDETLSWTDRMRIATTRLVRRREFAHHD